MWEPPPDWYPDPADDKRLRYWDGYRWTSEVAVGGRRTTDPMRTPYVDTDFAAGFVVRMVRLGVFAVLLALFAAAMWFAWLGWDHEYYDVDGVAQGPYRAWQVIGCGLAIAAGTVLAYLRVRGIIAMLVLASAADIGFAVAWGRDASSDETGMWAFGLLVLLVGSGVGLTVLLLVVESMTGSRWSPSHALALCGVLTVVALGVYPPLAIVPFAGTVYVYVRQWRPNRR